MNARHLVLIAVIIAFLGAHKTLPAATTNLYASFNNGNSLDIGSPSSPSVDPNGSPTTVLGMTNTVGGNTFNAVHFGASGSLPYGASSNYVSGFTAGGTVQSNTFRLLYKPDFSGNPTSFRANFLSLGFLASYNGIYLGTDDNNGGRPSFRPTIHNGFEPNTTVAGFSWDSNTWYYIAASMDANGSALYVRALTNGSTAYYSTDTFANSTWGSGGAYSDAIVSSLRIGGRTLSGDVSAANESARGSIDEVMILGGQKFGLSEFNYDFALVIPEPSTAALALSGLMLGWCHLRQRRRN